jgi:site-specific recombinase XerD
MRDHAILMLLARLGLRGGEVAGLRLSDIDSTRGRIRIVASKSGHVDMLPMPRDVQSSIVRYLKRGRPRTADDHVFVRSHPPFVAGASASMISQMVERTLRKAGVTAPNRGAYVFRHSIATKLLRAGWTLQAIGALLRHRHEETTAIYAKVDFGTLRAVVRRWPDSAAPK